MYLINQERTLALSIVFTCLATLLVVLRLFTRRNVDKRQKKNSPTPLVYGNHLDDVFCFLALVHSESVRCPEHDTNVEC